MHLFSKRVQLFSFMAIALMLFTGLSACGNSSSGQQGPILIGASVPLTGDFSADGKALQQGYQLWEDGVNQKGGLLGRQIKLDLINDNSDAKQTTINYQKLITIDKVDLLMGPMGPATSNAGLLVAARYGYAYIEGVGSTDLIFDTVHKNNLNNHFAVSLPVHAYPTVFDKFVFGLPAATRPKTVALMGADDPFALSQSVQAAKELSAGGLQTVLNVTYPVETTDFSSLAQQVVQANADVVVLGTSSTTECVAFIKAFEQQHYNPKAFFAFNGPDQGSSFTDAIGGVSKAEDVFVADGSWSPDLNSFQNSQFVSAYIAKYGGAAGDISATTAEAFSVGQVLEQAVDNTKSLDNKTLISALHTLSFKTVQGGATFSSMALIWN